MQSFLEEVVEDIWQKYGSTDDLIFILPSKRAGNYLKKCLAKTAAVSVFSPDIFSTESFVESISGLKPASAILQQFELYMAYLEHLPGNKESFLSFSKWGRILLQDFSEVDRYLVPPAEIFNYLSAIQEVNHWYLQAEKTEMMNEYIKFWNNLESLYRHFNGRLLSKGLGHQGLIYRTACDNITSYLSSVSQKKHIFVGFNALNKSESLIIEKILQSPGSDIYWDVDTYFIEDPIHDAGFFIRQHQREWSYFRNTPLKGLSSFFLNKKNIRVVGVPRQISQVKYVGSLLNELEHNGLGDLRNTAIVLGDESLLNPLLNGIPDSISKVNITMGYPLAKTPIAGMFEQFFELYLHPDKEGWSSNEVFAFLTHNLIQQSIPDKDVSKLLKVRQAAKTSQLRWIDLGQMKAFQTRFEINLSHLFFETPVRPATFITRCLELIGHIRANAGEQKNHLILEYLYRFYTLLNQLQEMLLTFPYINDLRTLYSLFKELADVETVDFRGEPFEGIQIMGMLESRNLDFETVIITSVNEGILPSGKSNNSFIPFDVKKQYGLPTYKEKDAVYTYHFYRLLQRAANIFIVYNTQPDVLEGGERSRFISQLLLDENRPGDVTHILATPELQTAVNPLQRIVKDQELMQRLKLIASSGISPSALSSYIRNPIGFYKQSILGVREDPGIEGSMGANTFGTLIHHSMEELYRPSVGRFLTADGLKKLFPLIETVVTANFAAMYPEEKSRKGKYLIAFHVIVRYLSNFIQMEIESVEHHQIKILALEEKCTLSLNISGISFPVLLKGNIDRIEERDGILRIVDYKTGSVQVSQLAIIDWEEIIRDPNLDKAFQLLCYALLYGENGPSMEAGIIPFKNLSLGWIPLSGKEKKGGIATSMLIDGAILGLFREQLAKLLVEIFNPLIDFIESEG